MVCMAAAVELEEPQLRSTKATERAASLTLQLMSSSSLAIPEDALWQDGRSITGWSGKCLPVRTSHSGHTAGWPVLLVKAKRYFSGSSKKGPGQRGTYHRGGQTSKSVHTPQRSNPDRLEHNPRG